MKRLVLATVFFASTAAIGLHAQSGALKANIPFEFHVGSRVMPAGEYLVYNANSVITLRGTRAPSPTIMTVALSVSPDAKDRPSTLVFNRYGNEYFLAKIWGSAGSRRGAELRKGRFEKELIARGAAVQTAGVPARAK